MDPQHVIAQLTELFDHSFADDLAFRPICRADAFPLFDAAQHPAFNEFLLWSQPSDPAQALAQVEKLIRASRTRQVAAASVCNRWTGEWVGYAAMKPFRDGVEIGMALHPKVWNAKVGVTVSSVLTQLINRVGNELKIYTRVTPANVKMQKICSGLGGEKVAVVYDNHLDGHQMEFDVFSLNKEKWVTLSSLTEY